MFFSLLSQFAIFKTKSKIDTDFWIKPQNIYFANSSHFNFTINGKQTISVFLQGYMYI